MKARLLYPDRDVDPRQVLPDQARDLIQDLELETLLGAMAGGDPFLDDVARKTILSGLKNDVQTIRYRQEVLQDCLNHPAVVRQLYEIASSAISSEKKDYYGVLAKHPSFILQGSIHAIEMLVNMLRKLRGCADAHGPGFASSGFTTLFAMLQKELSDDYLAAVQDHLTKLNFRRGVLLSAELGQGNAPTNYLLCKPSAMPQRWLAGMFGTSPPGYTFRLGEHDETGGRILSDMKDRGIDRVANAVAQARDHILGFFVALRSELAFYLGGLNLRDRLAALGAPICMPCPRPVGQRQLRFTELYDPCLALAMGARPVGNCADAAGKGLILITGANQGGKSSFLRSIGLAQLMMQSGLFVPAGSFEAEMCTDLFTHYRREEDPLMKSGKLDEELARLSGIVDRIGPNALILFNESFAATNEREGSEIARQIVSALLEQGIKIAFVTHRYEFARGLYERKLASVLFLRAERTPDGTRTFKLVEGEPLPSSFGADLYRRLFGSESAATPPRSLPDARH
jgi:DNA mismatch repair ATPase MutS